jgi:predicted ATPase/DNA-binding SARP family transcriptional activator
MSLSLFLLGPPQVKIDGTEVYIRRRKALAVMVYLAVTGKTHSRDTLATMFWPEYDHSGARAGLRRILASIRRVLGSDEWLDVARETTRVREGAEIELDVSEFQNRVRDWRRHNHPQDNCPDCIDSLETAVKLYRDDFLSGFSLPDCPAFDDWGFFQREGLRDDLACLLEWLARAYESRGEYEIAITHARCWIELDPLHEPAHVQLMKLCVRSGQRSAALRQYRECERILQEELSVPPQEETQVLHQAILENRVLPKPLAKGEIALEFSRLKHNLPTQPIPFVGRDELLAEIAVCLADSSCRLLTLVGPGGCGKTRLALEAGERALENYAQGVFFVSLEPLDALEAIVPTIAHALGFSFYEGVDPKQQLLNFLEKKSMLILMDNFEHMLEGVDIITEILNSAPDVKITATSRARLNLYDERILLIPGMEHPPLEMAATPADVLKKLDHYSAVKLFAQSARWAQPEFELAADNLAHVTRICHLVDGMPLGILMAAAWLKMLSLEEIAFELEQGLDILETKLRDVPLRQRSMRAVFDYSWQLLNVRERKVFMELSVFRAGFSRKAAGRVTGASLPELMELVDRSLVQRDISGRCQVHRLLRQYGMEKLEGDLSEYEAVKDRHSLYYASMHQRWERDLKSARQENALVEMDQEIKNCRIAWEWAAERGQLEKLDQSMESLGLYYLWRRRFEEGHSAFRFAAGKLAENTSADGLKLMCRILVCQGRFDDLLYRDELAQEDLQESERLLEDPRLAGVDTRAEQAYHLEVRGELEQNRKNKKKLFEECLALYRELGDRWKTAAVLCSLCDVEWELGDMPRSRQLAEEGLALCQELGDPRGTAKILTHLGLHFWFQRQSDQGMQIMDESLSIYRGISDPGGYAHASKEYASFLISQYGMFKEAQPYYHEALRISDDLGIHRTSVHAYLGLGTGEASMGEYKAAVSFAEKGLKLAREINARRFVGDALNYIGICVLAEGSYAESQRLFEEIIDDYRENQPLSNIAIAHACLGAIALQQGKISQARGHLLDGLRAGFEMQSLYPFLMVAPGIALYMAVKGEVERGVALYALMESQFPFVKNSQFIKDIFKKGIDKAASDLPPEVITAAEAHGRKLDIWETGIGLLSELEGPVEEGG